MAGLRIDSGDLRGVLGTLFVGAVALAAAPACRQMPPAGSPDYTLSGTPRQDQGGPTSTGGQQSPPVRGQSPSLGPFEGAPLSWPPPEAASGQQVLDVQIVGAGRTPKAEIRRLITTRRGRPFDLERIYEDVRQLSATHKFVDIRPYYREIPGGCAVIFEVRERPVVEYVNYVGNQKVPKKTLQKESEIKVGDALDPFTVEGGRQRLQEFYREKGFFKARVTIFEGKQEGDRGVVYEINEGESPRILWTSFVGNTIASDAKLRTKIQSKPGFLWIFKGEVDREQIDADRQRLENYYRSLGYYRARIGHPILEFDARRKWLVLTFVIDEGPRFEVRRVSFVGNTKFTSDELAADLSLEPGQFFNQANMQSDLNTIVDEYGAIGYICADVNPDVRLLKPGQLDVVYEIAEGEPCYVGRIEPRILGDGSHTNLSTIFNRLSFHPGEPVDIREVRASERRLKFSGLFEVDPRMAPAPRIVVHLPDLQDVETSIVRQPKRPGQSRGQSPDRRPAGFQSPSVVRGQFSAEAGQSVPPLRRPGSWLDQPPPNSYPPAESYSRPEDPIRDDVATGYDAPWGDPIPTAETANRLGSDGFPPFGDPLVAGPPVYVPISPEVYEGRTGKLMFSVAVNSEAGLLGSMIVDEQNFDWTRFPTSWDDIRNRTAWSGDGQRLRIEAVPGTRLHKYSATFQEPYWFDTNVSLSLSGYFYNRRYREWDEEQLGGRVGLGYQITNDLSGVFSFRGTKIQIYDPIVPTPAELTEVLGENALYGFRFHLAHDTRDHAFLATEGHLFEIGAEHVVGSFDYTRGNVDLRKYFMLRQHPDGTGRHVLSLNARASATGSQTPIYEHYYAGGFSTIRGFDFREASPRDPATGVVVGGHFMMLASAEYMFPLTADDNLRAVVFCDTGTVEPTIDHWTDDYRVAAGLGLRILVPGMGQAPIALDLAFPVCKQAGDDEQVFSFFIGFFR